MTATSFWVWLSCRRLTESLASCQIRRGRVPLVRGVALKLPHHRNGGFPSLRPLHTTSGEVGQIQASVEVCAAAPRQNC